MRRKDKNLIVNSLKDLKKYYGEDDLDKCDIYSIIYHFKLTENFIEKHLFPRWRILYGLRWDLPYYQEMSEKFIEEHLEMFDFKMLCLHQKLPSDFVVKYANKIDYNWLLLNDYIDWYELESKGVDVIVKMYNYKDTEDEY